jgi:chaperonin GroEL
VRAFDADAVLGDVAAVVGTRVVESGNLSGDAAFGFAEKIIAGMASTKFIADGGEFVPERVAQIRGQIDACADEYMGAKLRERLARLTGGVAVISVGLATEIETHEKKLRLDDALMAAKAARRDGIVAGGGLTYILVAEYLTGLIDTLPAAFRVGAGVLAESLPVVLRQICENAGVSADLVLSRVGGRIGFDAMNGEFVDMFAANIIDPAAVVISVVKNAASVAATLLTTEVVVA